MTPVKHTVAQIAGSEERAAIVAWLRRDVGIQAGHLMLAVGLPGGTATQRVKRRAYADGLCAAVSAIIAGLERGDHLLSNQDEKHGK